MSQVLNLTRAGALERIVKRPEWFCMTTLLYAAVGLGIEPYTDHSQQLMLGISTWIFLGLTFSCLTPAERAQTSLVVLIATVGEVLGSVVCGIYEYRLSNLPMYVPPGHGIVYLTGLRLSQVWWVRGRTGLFVGMAIIGVFVWALLGLFAFERTDVAGAVGAAMVVIFLLRGREPCVYACVFFAVAFLELYGTSLGNWAWAERIPFINVPNGNPPSGIANGYILFDIGALALAPSLLAISAGVRVRLISFKNRSGLGAWTGMRPQNLKLSGYLKSAVDTE
jgi:hypothetical protein